MSNVHPKVQAAGWAGALSVIVVWIAGQAGLEIPAEVASALTVLFTTAAGWAKSA